MSLQRLIGHERVLAGLFELLGHAFIAVELPSSKATDHSVLTEQRDEGAVATVLDFLRDRLQVGQGRDVLYRIAQSQYRPSKKLMEHVSGMIQGNPAYVLLDEQQVRGPVAVQVADA